MQNLIKKVFLYFLFILFVFCEKNQGKKEWSNNSYGIVVDSKDTIKLDLYTNTYCFFDDDYYNGINSWKIEVINNSSYLKLKNSFTIILDENFIKNRKGNIIGHNNIPVKIVLLKSKWDNLTFDGNWIKKTDLEVYKKIKEGKYILPPPPPPPPPPYDIEDFVYPPVLKIEKNTAYLYDWYSVDTSKISISLTKQVLLFSSEHKVINKTINMIRIKNSIKDTLYVEIKYAAGFSSIIENDTLVRIKR